MKKYAVFYLHHDVAYFVCHAIFGKVREKKPRKKIKKESLLQNMSGFPSHFSL